MSDATGPVRIGNCSGYYGDRLSAMREMLEATSPTGEGLDYLTGDYLAELTMLILGRDRLKDESLGYAKTYLRQMADCMALAHERGVRIVTNAGGLNPAGLASALREIAADQGVDVAIAHVEGDDVRESGDFTDALTANAYLGAFGIAAALQGGADIVVTGRVTDASVVVGPAIAHFGWSRDDLDALAGAVVAGHVIECGTQATGGNFAGFAALKTSGLDVERPLGFPIAEIAADGTTVVTKNAGHGGAVTVDTVTAQLLYEIQGPTYLNPDVSTHLDTIELSTDGPDRVRISGVRGSAPPATTKVCLNALGGFRNSVEFLLTGLDIEAKATWVRAQMDSALSALPPAEIVWRLDRCDVADPPTQAQATAYLHCHVRSDQPDPVGRAFSDAAVQIALASYPGFTVSRPPAAGTPFGVYRAAYLPQVDVPHVVVHHDGRREDIAPPSVTEPPANGADPGSPRPRSTRSSPLAETSAPLGTVAYARSGDKGGNANVGVWIPAGHPGRADAAAWLLDLLDVDTVRTLLPEAAALDIDVHPLPNLAGLNIVVHGLLGEGVASSTRLDPQAKALGEWLRARFVPIPEELMP
ncbi:acyclic terpene utilization AtuA family protein [Aeromicrobium sp. CF3.5]|uniref:acyclic terpene utilization AtuA family protein n=1 Tax=Aeromicrobium sp. CF3.5 TaxID=3373078 RepID=UPI003EE77F4A